MFRNYFEFYISNPLKTYWKVRKFWKAPTIHFKLGTIFNTFGFPICQNACAKILHIDSFDVMWKDKYNSPRHEYDPIICITLFKKWRLSIWWTFEINKNNKYNTMYWESILDYLYYDFKTPITAVNNNIWQHSDSNGNKYNTPVRKFLK